MANPVITNRTSHQGIVELEASPDDLCQFAGADTLVHGTILARKKVVTAITPVADGGNTGNGTCATASVVAGPVVPAVGSHNLECTKSVSEVGTPTATSSAVVGTGNGTCTALSVTEGDKVLPGAYVLTMTELGTANGTAVGAAAFTGTGNGTASAVVCGAKCQAGDYLVTCIDATVSGSEIFNVIAPDGSRLEDLTVGVAYLNSHLGITLTDGSTDFIVGDYWTVTVTDTGGIFSLTDPNGRMIANDIVMDAGALQATAIEVGGIAFTLTDGSTDFIVGDYFTITVANTGAVFKLEDPNGMLVLANLVASAGAGAATTFEAGGLTFIITDGSTDFIVGDKFALPVVADGDLVAFATDGIGGAQLPLKVAIDPIVATGAADITCRPLAKGVFKYEYLVIDADGDNSNVTAEIKQQLQAAGIRIVGMPDRGALDNE